MPRSMARPTSAGDQEGERQRDGQRPVEQAGRGGADRLLHDEGRVGAEHHHLAMRHVDDAHDAEGDGEADRGEQQHRAQRDAVPDVLPGRPHGQRLVDAGDCRRSRRPSARLRRVASNGGQQRQRVAVAARADAPSIAASLSASGQVGNQHGRGARLFEPRLDAGIGLLGDAPHRARRCRRDRACGTCFRRRQAARAGSADASVSVPSASRMTRAQRVVDLDLGRGPPWRRFAGRLAGERVEQADASPASCR